MPLLSAINVQSGHITIWTDVDGVFSADPRKVPEAVCLQQLRCAGWRRVAAWVGGCGCMAGCSQHKIARCACCVEGELPFCWRQRATPSGARS